ncbi:MAG: hypothetical protein NDJ72_05125 [Elusimicrobia bacterium]|nr:hypothetical protein [Elusimicrobiota bacterium]
MNPWPRQLIVRSVVCLAVVGAALVLRAPRVSPPPADIGDLRDSVGEHRILLSGGHASFACGACHISHATKAARPLWQTAGTSDAGQFVKDSAAAGGVKTNLCMSCHDGTIAPTITAHSVSGGGADLGANHPVGIDYRAAVTGNPGSFNDPESNPRIILEDGMVACISCHSTHDVSPASGGSVRHEVCIECHRR